MKSADHLRGGAAVGVLNRLDPWEAAFVINLRLWCEGARGQSEVREAYRRSLSQAEAEHACRDFETLLGLLFASAHRPFVRHDVGCGCVGSDECILAHLVRTASSGHLADAALIATLMAGPAKAELIACLAGAVGEILRSIHGNEPEGRGAAAPRGVTLH